MTQDSTYSTAHSNDHLALIRTRLANERTGLAYARTSIMLIASGGAILKLYSSNSLDATTGWILIMAGVIVGTWGILNFRSLAQSLA